MEIIILIITGLVLYIAEDIFYGKMWHRGLEARVEMQPQTAFPEEKGTLTLTISNNKLLPLPWLWVELQISSALQLEGAEKAKDEYTFHNSLFCIMGMQKIKRTYSFTCKRRGYYPLKSLDVIGTSILFNGKCSKHFECKGAITVYPKLVNEEDIDEVLCRPDGIAVHKGYINPDPFELAGIREYVPTDSFKDINFKASAHMGELMTNTHNPTIKGNIRIFLCFKLLKQAFERERFEYAISLAAALAQRYISNGFAVSLVSNGIDEATGEATTLYEGTGDGYFIQLLESLARVSYTKTKPVEVLTPAGESEAAAVFISPTVDRPILKLYREIEKRYSGCLWLFPVMEFDIPRASVPTQSARLVSVPPER